MADNGDNAWILISSGLVFLMLPGIALFYSGLRSQATILSLLLINMMAFSLVTIQWFLFGYSLVFSPTSNNHIIGNLYNALFQNTMLEDFHPGIPEKDVPILPHALFQGMFAAFTITIITGVIAERGRLVPFLLFTILWTTFGYDPVAYWMWNTNGWGDQWHVLDWAGGTPVHIASGAASFAYTLMLKHIRKTSEDDKLHSDISEDHDPDIPSGPKVRNAESQLIGHNLPYAFLGLLLVWFGWFGFNAGSELKANRRAASTFVSTHIAATSGGFAFCLFQRWKSNWSGIGFCTGALAGLVAITPGAGYVPMWSALIFGISASLICHAILFFTATTRWLEEPLDIVVVHGVGGLWGMFLTGIFADQAVAALDGTVIKGGAIINHHPMQIVYQLVGGLAGFAWSFLVALLILSLIHFSSRYVNGLELRTKPRLHSPRDMWVDEEEQGDEHPYNFYYAPVDREHKLVPAPASGRHVHVPLPTSIPIPTPTTEPDADPDLILPSATVLNFSKVSILGPVSSVFPSESLGSGSPGESTPMKKLDLKKTDVHKTIPKVEYIGLNRGGDGTIDDNFGEGSLDIRPSRGGEPLRGSAKGDFAGSGRGDVVVHGGEASA